ncbi:folate-binding protein [Ramlibacter sp.]|uniref:CAF17-like 4Fe-4S cluster assembly/insertion protein YgfZ n=1 Tax=Ramlibacter sp. TaxID=1917967 RepID=UPI002C79107F|nr:folate-binding protein [Ramlibacter sp.]HWI82968.1 folate-binding protein [Ramlibacter sp.]
MSHVLNGISPLPHLGVLRVDGEDATSLLQGQLTQDFALLRPDEARLAAYCTPKGRMQASFIGFKRSQTEVVLVVSRDILEAVRKRLSMFVMRAKAKLSDASAEFALYGLAGEAALAAAADGPPWSRAQLGAATVIRLYPADGQPRRLWIGAAAEAPPPGPALDPALWQWGEVRSGIATVSAPIVEAFVPQMLNYESVGGVNFKKGCYPGQEVVARSQFRGTLKRRAYLAHSNEVLQAGQDVFHESDAEQPCGLVAQAAAAPRGGWDAIVSLQITAAAGGRITGGAPDGPPLAVAAPPYPLLADL